MKRPVEFVADKTTIELDTDLRKYLVQRAIDEGRTLKWLINNAVRNEMRSNPAPRTRARA